MLPDTLLAAGVNRTRTPPKPEHFEIRDSHSFWRGKEVLFVEQEPQVRITRWCFNGYHEDRVLSFPRMLFAPLFNKWVFVKLHLFFLKQPYAGRSTPLFQTILPNGTDSGWVCIGNEGTIAEIMQKTRELDSWEAKADVVLDYFWNKTNFNDHVFSRFGERAPQIHPNLTSLATWERTSRANPNFVLNCNWIPAGTVKDFIHRLKGG